MPPRSLVLLKGATVTSVSDAHTSVIGFDDLKRRIADRTVLRSLFRYGEARLLTYRIETLAKPLLTALLVRALARGGCRFEDEYGERLPLTTGVIARMVGRLARDSFRRRPLLRAIERDIAHLAAIERPRRSPALRLGATPVYLRTDLWFGVQSGGSVGHIAGVLNELDCFTGPPVLLTTDHIPTVREDIETHVILPGDQFWDFTELPSFAFNERFTERAIERIGTRRCAFIYQRYSTNNYSGLKLARYFSVPFVLEYNGSEIWINRHWGRPLRHEALSERIELLNLRAADVVVVVSEPMRDELTARGIDPAKVLVNPNGVDPSRYAPDVDGTSIRQRYGWEEKTVIGFIGTFGPWHGAEVLAQAFAKLVQQTPAYRESVRLFMIGDGARLSATRTELERAGLLDICHFAGRIAQRDGPAHLAACDVLASPHVPNPDGTPFFGSPTKLFEYMAMGRGIVASDLDQIGEILEHDRTAILVEPGNAEALAAGLRALVDDPARRARLGQAARGEVLTQYTWREHTRKIIEMLRERCE